MNKHLNRRHFVKRSSTTVAGLLASDLLLTCSFASQQPDSSQERLLQLGLNALARGIR